MFELENTTPEHIKERILGEITRLNTQQGSFADDMAGPVAYEIFRLYTTLYKVPTMVWPDETGGEFLDLKAKDVNLERKEGARAEVVLELTGETGYTLPQNTAFLTQDNLYFYTLGSCVLEGDTPVLVPAVAESVGQQYNVAKDTIITRFSDDSRITAVTNPHPATGGVDKESDSDFYHRIDSARKRPATSGNKYHYEEWAKEVDGVGFAHCIPIWNGPGTVKVVIGDGSRFPIDDTIVQRCAKHIEKQRPIGPAVTVVTTTTVALDISATIVREPESSLGQITEEYKGLIERELPPLALDLKKIIYHWVTGALISIPGVIDYTGLTINGGTANIPITVEQVPVLGQVVIT